ncbi:hypothetical protein L1887_56657 [Cichorium endivia]|nr:hypothetical protein L1887_56657 [Cichorium endivia]
MMPVTQRDRSHRSTMQESGMLERGSWWLGRTMDPPAGVCQRRKKRRAADLEEMENPHLLLGFSHEIFSSSEPPPPGAAEQGPTVQLLLRGSRSLLPFSFIRQPFKPRPQFSLPRKSVRTSTTPQDGIHAENRHRQWPPIRFVGHIVEARWSVSSSSQLRCGSARHL